MTLLAGPPGHHRAVSAGFTARVRGASDWDAAAPVAGWLARDVVAHLVEWFPGFLSSATGLVLDRGPSPEEDPVAAWQVHADVVQRPLDGSERLLIGDQFWARYQRHCLFRCHQHRVLGVEELEAQVEPS